VFITDWRDAAMVPLALGGFDLDDYIDYVIDMFGQLGPGAACDGRYASPPCQVLAAVALMSDAWRSLISPRP
jgi:poly(3-hydroxybutyrate) depolymerase